MLHQSDVKKQKKNFPLFVTRDELPVSVMQALQLLPSLPSNDNVRFCFCFFCMCVVARLITGERRGEERYCVSRFSDSPHLLISSKSRPNGATEIDLAKRTHTHTAPAVYQGRFPSLCCAPRFTPDVTQFDCFVLLSLSRKHLAYCFVTTPLIKWREIP